MYGYIISMQLHKEKKEETTMKVEKTVGEKFTEGKTQKHIMMMIMMSAIDYFLIAVPRGQLR